MTLEKLLTYAYSATYFYEEAPEADRKEIKELAAIWLDYRYYQLEDLALVEAPKPKHS